MCDVILVLLWFQFKYGFFPDDQASCILLNHLLVEKKYEGMFFYLHID